MSAAFDLDEAIEDFFPLTQPRSIDQLSNPFKSHSYDADPDQDADTNACIDGPEHEVMNANENNNDELDNVSESDDFNVYDDNEHRNNEVGESNEINEIKEERIEQYISSDDDFVIQSLPTNKKQKVQYEQQQKQQRLTPRSESIVDLTEDEEKSVISNPLISSVPIPAVLRSSSLPLINKINNEVISPLFARRNITDFFPLRPSSAKELNKQTILKSPTILNVIEQAKSLPESIEFTPHDFNKHQLTANKWKYLLTGRGKEAATGKVSRGGRNIRGGAGKKGGNSSPGNSFGRFTLQSEKTHIPSDTSNISAVNHSYSTYSSYSRSTTRICPAYKRILGTSILVDGFVFSNSPPQAKSFFLSHHHSDHTVGLWRGWSVGIIYCSPITASLLKQQNGISEEFIIAIPLHERTYIETENIYVTLICANHCPGAVIFIFELPPFAKEIEQQNIQIKLEPKGIKLEGIDNSAFREPHSPVRVEKSYSNPLVHHRLTDHGPCYVHVGDFRYHPSMRDIFLPYHPIPPTPSRRPLVHMSLPYFSLPYTSALSHLSVLSISGVYLDTTYASRQYEFPSQEVSVSYCVSVVQRVLEEDKKRQERSQLTIKERPLEKENIKEEDFILEEDDEDITMMRSTNQPSNSLTEVLKSFASSVYSSITSFQSPLPSFSSSFSFLDGYRTQATTSSLILVGSYSIGKEKVFLQIAKRLQLRVYCNGSKLRLLRSLSLFDGEENIELPASTPYQWSRWCEKDVLTTDLRAAQLHVVPLSVVAQSNVIEYLDPTTNKGMKVLGNRFNRVICFRPTGWVGNQERMTTKTMQITSWKEENNLNKSILTNTKLPTITNKKRGRSIKNKNGEMMQKKNSVSSPIPPSTTSSVLVRGVIGVNANGLPIMLPQRNINVEFHSVPYSEHSTFSELQAFLDVMKECGVKREGIIPTVNVFKSAQIVEELLTL